MAGKPTQPLLWRWCVVIVLDVECRYCAECVCWCITARDRDTLKSQHFHQDSFKAKVKQHFDNSNENTFYGRRSEKKRLLRGRSLSGVKSHWICRWMVETSTEPRIQPPQPRITLNLNYFQNDQNQTPSIKFDASVAAINDYNLQHHLMLDGSDKYCLFQNVPNMNLFSSNRASPVESGTTAVNSNAALFFSIQWRNEKEQTKNQIEIE